MCTHGNTLNSLVRIFPQARIFAIFEVHSRLRLFGYIFSKNTNFTPLATPPTRPSAASIRPRLYHLLLL